MKYLRIGYAMNPALSTVTQEDACRLTHINLAFGLVKEGLLDLSILPDLPLIPQFRQWNPELKIVLSVGGWGADGFSPMAKTGAGRKAFAASCRSAVEQYGLDGIDIDWEYPCSSEAGIQSDPADKENFTLLLKALRDALGGERILSVAVGGAQSCVDGTQMEKVAEIVDYVQLMTYDLAGEFPGKACHHAGLGISRVVVERYHTAGVPYGKMVLGAAFYGRHFTVASAENNGLMQPAGAGLPGPTYGEMTADYLREHGYRSYWDEAGEGAYCFNGTTFISYESPESIRRKCAFVQEKGMKGIMYWEHGNDPTRELLGVIAETLQ